MQFKLVAAASLLFASLTFAQSSDPIEVTVFSDQGGVVQLRAPHGECTDFEESLSARALDIEGGGCIIFDDYVCEGKSMTFKEGIHNFQRPFSVASAFCGKS